MTIRYCLFFRLLRRVVVQCGTWCINCMYGLSNSGVRRAETNGIETVANTKQKEKEKREGKERKKEREIFQARIIAMKATKREKMNEAQSVLVESIGFAAHDRSLNAGRLFFGVGSAANGFLGPDPLMHLRSLILITK